MTDEPVSTSPEATDAPEVKTPKSTPVQQEEDYEKRFKGLQKLFEKQQKKLQELEAENTTLAEKREELDMTQKQVQAEIEKFKAELETSNKEKETLTAKLSAHEAQVQRTNIILSEFSDLAAFEAKGLLPPASTEEEMRQKFDDFRNAIKTTIDQNVQTKIQGAGPAPTAPTTPPAGRSKEQIYSELTRLAGARDEESRRKYEELVAEWDKLS